jgi:hypothetical protein
MTRRLCLAAALAFGLCLLAIIPGSGIRAAGLPAQLTDQEFWQFVTESSEPDGFFRSDNLTSNELWFQYVVPDLMTRAHPGGVYLGVGPEQNFTYMAAVAPAMAIIFDIRRGNMLLHLMYKAIFELSNDRADFVSMLFSKPRPAGLGPSATASELFLAFTNVPANDSLYAANLQTITARLAGVHQFPLSATDLAGIERVYRAFYSSGFRVRPSPTYEDLMIETDRAGVRRSYLATENNFATIKALETRNLVIPVVGDFAGPKAIRAVGTYLKEHGGRVSAFYLSNVEQYLTTATWSVFCKSVATLPLDQSSTFIRSSSQGGGGFISSLGEMAHEVEFCR